MLRNGVGLIIAIWFALTGVTGMLSNVSPVFDYVTAGVIAMLALPLFALFLALTLRSLLVGLAFLLFFLCGYLGIVFVVFLAYSIELHGQVPEPKPLLIPSCGQGDPDRCSW